MRSSRRTFPSGTRRMGLWLATLASCSGTPEGTLDVVTGDETDVFDRAPAVVTLVTEKIALDGTRTELARTPLPADAVRLRAQQRTDVDSIAVTGFDAAGSPVVRGETLFVQWGALEDTTLDVFVQRLGELARMPRGPAAFDPLATTLITDRFVFAANGTSTMLYDLLALKPVATTALTRPARSVASVNTALLVIDEAGATTVDLSSGTTFPQEAPQGGTFAEVAGGARTVATDGTQYIVGATRSSGGPTSRILVVGPDGNASFAALVVPREGACATWVEGRGLVVVGGAAAGAGAELLASGAAIATPLPFPPDMTTGCGAATLDNGHVALAGGVMAGAPGPVRVLDLACTSSCGPTPWSDDIIPLTRAEAFAVAADAAFVVGDDATGATHAYRASPTSTREVPLRVARRGARALRTPTGSVVIFGGGVGIEQYLE